MLVSPALFKTKACHNSCSIFSSFSGSKSSGSNPSAGKGRRASPREKDPRSTCCVGTESEHGTWPGIQGQRAASQLSHHSHNRSCVSHTCSGHSRATSHRSHSVSKHSHASFSYTHAPFTQPGHASCGHSERSHASSYNPPGLPPPYCLARLAPRTTVSSGPPGAPPVRELANIPPELTASRQSFQHAMGNPCEFFVDIMWQDSAFQFQSTKP